MSNENQQNSILQQVVSQREKKKKDSLKSKLDSLLTERESAMDVLIGIDKKIIDECVEVGLNEQEIKDFLSSLD